jgi:hypothetical protein
VPFAPTHVSSFGVRCMRSGRRDRRSAPSAGDTGGQTTLAAVLNEPRTRSHHHESTRAFQTVVAWVIEQCLSKDAGERYMAPRKISPASYDVFASVSGNARRTGAAQGPRRRRWKMPAAMLGRRRCITAIGILALETGPYRRLRLSQPVASSAGYEGTPCGRLTSKAWHGSATSVWGPRRSSHAALRTPVGELRITRGRFEAETAVSGHARTFARALLPFILPPRWRW